MLDFIHLSAMGVAKIAKTTNLKGCPHTFVYIVYTAFTVNAVSATLIVDRAIKQIKGPNRMPPPSGTAL